jgi:hypothetical protein
MRARSRRHGHESPSRSGGALAAQLSDMKSAVETIAARRMGDVWR